MCDDFQPRLKAADLKKLAAGRLAELQAEGLELHPVANSSRKLAAHFWGSAWMKHLALCESGGMCLAPGRTLLRHGCALAGEQLEALSLSCGNHINSLLSLLEGKVDDDVLEQLCHPEAGILPTPQDWKMRCTCPDWAEPCPRAAAAIYAAGSLIDADPKLLFTLRSIEPEALLAPPAQSAGLDTDKLSSLFGIDIDMNPAE